MITDDLIQPFQIDGNAVRGRLVRMGPAVDTILERHDYPPPVAALLGEALALCAALAATLKFDGVFSLQAKGDGLVRLLVADVTTEGNLRGYARLSDDGSAPLPDGSDVETPSVADLLGKGYLAFTVDQGTDTELYQGIVSLEGTSLTDCVHHYFRQSEQLRTGVRLAAQRTGDGTWRAAALMVQALPDEDGGDADENAEDWRRAMAMIRSCTEDEMLDRDLDPDRLLFRLFHEDGVRVYERRALNATCRCSRERIQAVLRQIGREELADLKIDGVVEVTCEFCNTTYDFDDEALDAVFATH